MRFAINSDLPTIAAFWIGPYLSWFEQMGLLSYLKHGHRTILYTRGEVKNVPAGVEVRPSQEIVDDELVIYKEKKELVRHPSEIYSDIFRWHLQSKTDYIYADADRFLLRPFDIFSRQQLVEQSFMCGNTFFRLRKNSPVLEVAFRFLAKKHPIPRWLPRTEQRYLRWRKFTGRGVPVSQMPWGTAGPHLLLWALEQTGENVFWVSMLNIRIRLRDNMELIFRSSEEARSRLEKEYVVGLNWGSIFLYDEGKFRKFLDHPPEGSWLAQCAVELGVNPCDAPVIETREKNREYLASITGDKSILL